MDEPALWPQEGSEIRWIGYILPLWLILLSIGLFVTIAKFVVAGGADVFDNALLSALHNTSTGTPIGPRWLAELARDVTALGSTIVIVLFTLLLVVCLIAMDRGRSAGFVLFVMVSAECISQLLKWSFDRPRPVIFHAPAVFDPSFPSGHSMLSMTFYLTAACLVGASRPSWTIPASALAVLISVAVGISRVYLGVHYPTDVAAGWLLGLAWTTICWTSAKFVRSLCLAR